MNLEAYRSLGFWTLALVYYARQDPGALVDSIGDRLAISFVAPLVRELRHQGNATDYSWMRYSEGGFHIRCQFRARSDAESEKQHSRVTAVFQSLKKKHPTLFLGEQRLSPIAEALNSRSGVSQLYTPGTLHAGPVRESGEELVYDHVSAYLYVIRAQTLWSDLALKALIIATTYEERLWIAITSATALLYQHGSCSAERASHALFIAATWRQHFGISGTPSDPQAMGIWGERARFESIAAQSERDPASILTLLPSSLIEAARPALKCITEGVSALAPERPALRAMQVLALVHQLFNRLGISLIDEAAICDLIHRQTIVREKLLPEAIQAESDQWRRYWSQTDAANV